MKCNLILLSSYTSELRIALILPNVAVQRAKCSGAAFAKAKDVTMYFAPLETPLLCFFAHDTVCTVLAYIHTGDS